jgi:hypothetical protein
MCAPYEPFTDLITYEQPQSYPRLLPLFVFNFLLSIFYFFLNGRFILEAHTFKDSWLFFRVSLLSGISSIVFAEISGFSFGKAREEGPYHWGAWFFDFGLQWFESIDCTFGFIFSDKAWR